MRQVLDVSHWNMHRAKGRASFAFLLEQDVHEVIIKASDGHITGDPFLLHYLFEAADATQRDPTFRTGIYHFHRAYTDPLEQADAYATVFDSFVKFAAGRLNAGECYFDFEERTAIIAWALIGRAERFAAECDRLTGVVSDIYTSKGYWNKWMYPKRGWARNRRLWVADYGYDSFGGGIIQPRLPVGWDTWHRWQFTKYGELAGIGGKVDLSRYP